MTNPSDWLDVTAIPSMPLEIERLRRSRTWRRCRTQPFLAYRCLSIWMAAWFGSPAGSLDDDDEMLAEIAGCTPIEWAAVKSDAMHGFEFADGRWYHRIIAAKAKEALTCKSTSQVPRKPRASVPEAPFESFEAFWSEYPRKVAKGAARSAYARALTKAGADVLLNSAKHYAHQVRLREPQFIPHPATWLNGERWKDGIAKEITINGNHSKVVASKTASEEIIPVSDEIARLRFQQARDSLKRKDPVRGSDPGSPN